MEKLTLAKPYANALFNIAQHRKSLDLWSTLLSQMVDLTQNVDFNTYINSPKTSALQVGSLLYNLIEKQNKLDKVTAKQLESFISLLVLNKRLVIVGAVAQSFDMLKTLSEQSIVCDVYTPYAMTEKQQTGLLNKLTKRFGGRILLNIKEEKSLIGGILIRYGDHVLDLSVKSKLQALKNHILYY